jgi:ribosomal protein S18 acetylase RimI-like enzyme
MMNPATGSIRRATLRDLDAAARLFDAYRAFYSRLADGAAAHRFIEERLRHNDSVIYLASSDADHHGAPIGFVQLYPSFSSLAMRRIWVLNDLFVVPATRRRGLGRALLERARQHAVDTGAACLTLATLVDNIGAQRLYESLGYACDNGTTKFYTLELA